MTSDPSPPGAGGSGVAVGSFLAAMICRLYRLLGEGLG